MKLRPLNSYLVVTPTEVEVTKSAFEVPEHMQKELKFGTVVSGTLDVKEGDRVVFNRISGHSFGNDLIINYSDLLGVIEQ